MQFSMPAWWTVLVLAAAAIVLAILGEPAPATALAAGALALPAVIRTRAVQEDVAEAVVDGPQHALAVLVDALGLEGRGVFLPQQDAAVQVFLPARDLDFSEVPVPEPGVILHRGRAGVAGALLPHPGQGLEDLWAAQSRLPQGQGLEEAVSSLRRALPALGLGDKVEVRRREGAVEVRFRPATLEGPCRLAADHSYPWSVQGGCPTVAFIAAMVARAVARPVQLQAVHRDEKVLRLVLGMP